MAIVQPPSSGADVEKSNENISGNRRLRMRENPPPMTRWPNVSSCPPCRCPPAPYRVHPLPTVPSGRLKLSEKVCAWQLPTSTPSNTATSLNPIWLPPETYFGPSRHSPTARGGRPYIDCV